MQNPVSLNWYADPESRVYGDTVYLYVTNSLPFSEQLNIDVVTTKDLVHYEEHRDILDMSTFPGATSAVWAPTVIDKDGKYYLIFAANNIRTEDQLGGLYIGVSESPLGPFRNVLADGRPLLNRIYGGAQPIDAHLFQDNDGSILLYYGGWGHLMVCRMNETMDGFLPMEEPCIDGVVRELTPEDYKEAPFVRFMNGKYHMMYSCGSWVNGTYKVRAASAEDPCGEFRCYGIVLETDGRFNGPGHNSAFTFQGKEYIAYHRRDADDDNRHHRRLCIDELPIENGFCKVEMT